MEFKLDKNLKHIDICLLLDFYGSLLTERQKELMSLYFNDDWSLSEIAEYDGASRQAVHSVIRRAVKRLKDIENSLALVKRQKELEKILKEMKVQVAEDNCEALSDLINDFERCLNRQ